MSKTIIIMDAPDHAVGIDEIGDENPYFLGAFGEVLMALKNIFPEGDFSDPTEITAATEKGNVRIEISKHTPVQSFMIHLEKEEGLEFVHRLCMKTNWRALDTESGRFIDCGRTAAAAAASKPKSWWKRWKK